MCTNQTQVTVMFFCADWHKDIYRHRLGWLAFVSDLKIPFHAFLGLIIAFEGITRIGLHACRLEIPLIILTLFISAKTISESFKYWSDLYHVSLRPPSQVAKSAVIGRTLCVCVGQLTPQRISKHCGEAGLLPQHRQLHSLTSQLRKESKNVWGAAWDRIHTLSYTHYYKLAYTPVYSYTHTHTMMFL